MEQRISSIDSARTPPLPPEDSGLVCFVLLARLHAVAADAAQLRHEYLQYTQSFGMSEILRAAKRLSLKARSVTSSWDRLNATALPAIAQLGDGRFMLVGRCTTAAHQFLGGKRAKGSRIDSLQAQLLDQSIAEHSSRLAAIDQALQGKRAELAATQKLVEKGERTLPLTAERASSVTKPADSKFVARHSALEIEQQQIEQDLAARKETMQALRAALLVAAVTGGG